MLSGELQVQPAQRAPRALPAPPDQLARPVQLVLLALQGQILPSLVLPELIQPCQDRLELLEPRELSAQLAQLGPPAPPVRTQPYLVQPELREQLEQLVQLARLGQLARPDQRGQIRLCPALLVLRALSAQLEQLVPPAPPEPTPPSKVQQAPRVLLERTQLSQAQQAPPEPPGQRGLLALKEFRVSRVLSETRAQQVRQDLRALPGRLVMPAQSSARSA